MVYGTTSLQLFASPIQRRLITAIRKGVNFRIRRVFVMECNFITIVCTIAAPTGRFALSPPHRKICTHRRLKSAAPPWHCPGRTLPPPTGLDHAANAQAEPQLHRKLTGRFRNRGHIRNWPPILVLAVVVLRTKI
ncbi:uncharacterized protein LOC133862099 isoform X2 [Alnus glutinosa]|nr:uncharacterized protein LOC133862099 isoform X2 [Alnus glutinosa]